MDDPSLTPLGARALDAAIAVGRRLGVDVEGATVLRDRYNLLALLPAAGLVARVATRTALVRAPAYLAREVQVARRLAAAGAPVTPPATSVDPGPHREDGLVVSFWQALEVLPAAQLDPAAAAQALLACHEALVDLPGSTIDAPLLPVLAEARAVARSASGGAGLGAAGLGARASEAGGSTSPADDLDLLDAATRRLEHRVMAALADGAPLQLVHGDAHLANCLPTPHGPIWGDWEEVIRAPREWDLACMLAAGRLSFADDAARLGAGRAAHAAYGGPLDDELLAVLVDVRLAQGAGWSFAVPPAQGDPGFAARRRAWLQRHAAA